MPSHSIPLITTVNVDDPTDVALWALVMKADPGRIVQAVQKVGPDAETIKKYLDAEPPTG